jgi:hypothetical protein
MIAHFRYFPSEKMKQLLMKEGYINFELPYNSLLLLFTNVIQFSSDKRIT